MTKTFSFFKYLISVHEIILDVTTFIIFIKNTYAEVEKKRQKTIDILSSSEKWTQKTDWTYMN